MTRRLVDTGPRGWLDIGSYARHGPGQRDRLSSAQMALIARTVRRAPEVMIKMLNQGGRNLGSVAQHLKYLDREGELPIETDEGDPLKGKAFPRRCLMTGAWSSMPGGRRRRTTSPGRWATSPSWCTR